MRVSLDLLTVDATDHVATTLTSAAGSMSERLIRCRCLYSAAAGQLVNLLCRSCCCCKTCRLPSLVAARHLVEFRVWLGAAELWILDARIVPVHLFSSVLVLNAGWIRTDTYKDEDLIDFG